MYAFYAVSALFGALTFWIEGGPYNSIWWIATLPISYIFARIAENKRQLDPKTIIQRSVAATAVTTSIGCLVSLGFPSYPLTLWPPDIEWVQKAFAVGMFFVGVISYDCWRKMKK
ncbi:MAG TPA: hypothetical protein VK171_03800 [Fimbriimonas sp.]|nr:hypothetical protein [Fimbriimonas sp.]